MNRPVQITYRHVNPSEALSGVIRQKASELDALFDRITACRVTVEKPHRHHQQGEHFRVMVAVEVPGRELVADRDPAGDPGHESAYQAVGDAFRAIRRQLADYKRRSPRPGVVTLPNGPAR